MSDEDTMSHPLDQDVRSETASVTMTTGHYSWFRQHPYFAAFSQESLLKQIMHHEQEPNNIRQYFNARLLRSIGTDDPYKLFLELEQMKKQWFFAQDTRQISKRKKLFQYIVDNRLLEDLYPKLDGQVDLIRLIVHVYRQIQQEAFGIVLINRKNQVFLVQNEKYYWSFPKGKLKLNPKTYRFESQWSCALREFYEEVNVDLSSWLPTQYWEAKMADQRMVGLFVIEDFDESQVQFDFDKREIIDIMWFNLSNSSDEAHNLRQYWKEQQRLSDPYYTALPFIEHLIFEYLPHKQKMMNPSTSEDHNDEKFSMIGSSSSSTCSSSPVINEHGSSDESHTSVECSIIDRLLFGRIPICSTVNAQVETCTPIRIQREDSQSSEVNLSCASSNESNYDTTMTILDRLNEAIRRSMIFNDETKSKTMERRVAVEA